MGWVKFCLTQSVGSLDLRGPPSCNELIPGTRDVRRSRLENSSPYFLPDQEEGVKSRPERSERLSEGFPGYKVPRGGAGEVTGNRRGTPNGVWGSVRRRRPGGGAPALDQGTAIKIPRPTVDGCTARGGPLTHPPRRRRVPSAPGQGASWGK